MTVPENPPGFVVRTEAQKAASDNRYRLERGAEAGWLHYASTTAPDSIWIAGCPPRGPWYLSIDHSGVADEIGALPALRTAGPGLVTFVLDTPNSSTPRSTASISSPSACRMHALPRQDGIAAAIDRSRAPGGPAHRQNIFRDALMDDWGGRCPLTGITEPALLRASHIVPWVEWGDEQRLDVHNGLLLSALWDAAFDKGLVQLRRRRQCAGKSAPHCGCPHCARY